MLTKTRREMIKTLSLEGLRSKQDIVRTIAQVSKIDDYFILEYAYALYRDGYRGKAIIDKILLKAKGSWKYVEELIYKLAARTGCGIRNAEICLERVGLDLVESDLDNERGLAMLVHLSKGGTEAGKAGKILRRLIFGLNEKKGWTDKIPWFGTGNVTKGIRRLKVMFRILAIKEFFYPWKNWHLRVMEEKFGRFDAMVDILVRKF